MDLKTAAKLVREIHTDGSSANIVRATPIFHAALVLLTTLDCIHETHNLYGKTRVTELLAQLYDQMDYAVEKGAETAMDQIEQGEYAREMPARKMPAPKHVWKLSPGDLVQAIIDYDPGGADVRSGDRGIVLHPAHHYEPHSGPFVQWLMVEEDGRITPGGRCNVYPGVCFKLEHGE